MLSAALVTGTTVTGAGLRRRQRASRIVPRSRWEIITLVHAHSTFLFIYLSLLVGLGAGLFWHAPCRGRSCGGCAWSRAAGDGAGSARRRPVLHRPRRALVRFTSPVRRACTAATARYGRRCDSGPSPRRSRADSTSTREGARCCSSPGSLVELTPAQPRFDQLQFESSVLASPDGSTLA